MNGRLLVLVLAVLALLARASASGNPRSLLGVPPNDGSKTIPILSVNDDFCDCRDGSDEPGTSACANGRFFCQNAGFKASSIFASRVNDGICEPDCCDGSDEYEGRIACPNRCHAMGETLRRDAQDKAVAYAEGLRIKKEYSDRGAAELEQLRQKQARLQTQVAEKKRDVEAKDAAKQQQEKLEEIERGLLELEAQKEKDAAAAAAAAAPAPAPPADPEDVGEAKTHDETEQHQQQEGEGGEQGKEAAPSAQEPAQEEQISHTRPEAEGARREFASASQELKALEKDLEDVTRSLEYGYGESNEWFQFRDKCYALDTHEYTYELCGYGKATQKAKSGHSSTSLGSWEGKGAPSSSSFKFSGGQSCWQGPARSLEVTLVCGTKEEVRNIAEPSRCTYAAEFVSPAACRQDALDEVKRFLAGAQ